MNDTPRASIGARRNPDTEAAVLDAAAAIIEEEGFAKLTIEAVARRARAGKATIYRWWPGRGHLLLALYSRAKSKVMAPDTGSLEGDLVLYVGHMLRQLGGSEDRVPLGPMLRIMIAEAQFDDDMRTALQRERQERWVQIDDIMQHAVKRGELTDQLTLAEAGQRIIAPIWFMLLNNTLPPPEKAADLVRTMMIDLRAAL